MSIIFKKIFSFSIFFGACLTLFNILKKDFWFDEAFSFFLAKQNIKDLLIATAADSHPPLYYLILHTWMKIVPNNEYLLRLPSFVFGIASFSVIYFLGKEFFDKKTAKITVLLAVTSPVLVYFSSETRMFSLWLLEGSLILLSFYKYLKTNKNSFLVFLLITQIAALFTHYYAIFLITTLDIYLFVNHSKFKKTIIPLLGIQTLSILIFLPWLKIYFPYPHPKCFCFNPIIGIPITLSSFILGGLGNTSLKSMFLENIDLSLKAVYATSLLIMFFLFIKGLKRTLSKKNTRPIIYYFFVPFILVSLISIVYPLFSPRAFLALSGVFYILTAFGIGNSKGKKLNLIVAVILILNLAVNLSLITNKNFHKEPLKESARGLNTKLLEDDIIAHASLFTYYPYRFYLKDRPKQFLVLPSDLTVETMSKIGYPTTPIAQVAKEKNRIWFVNIPHRAHPEDIEKSLSFLYSNFKLVSLNRYENIEIYLFEHKGNEK